MAYFITKAEVIAQAFNRKVEEAKIQDDLIESCGIRHLLPILGEDFYDDVVANPSNYVTLKTYLVPVIANHVKFEILPEIHTEISTAGLNQFTGQNKQPVPRNSLEGLRQTAQDLAKRMGNRLHKYLEDNTDTYPLYSSSSNPQNKVIIAGGIVLDVAKTDNDDDVSGDRLRYY